MREAAIHIVSKLRGAGHTAYLAGGCVRDRLMGLAPKDYDVATSATPQQARKLFRRSRSVGESFGVVLVQVGRHGIEVATFRAEWGYHDGRRPDHVIFTDAEHDAQRRDFTINGLFEDPIEGKVIDYVGGQEDLRARVIRAIGDPDERFAEDYLRMLRAVRFAARFDFPIEPQTAEAIRRHAPKLGRISRERIGMEMRAMMSAEAVRWMRQLHLDGPVLEEESRDDPAAALEALDPDADYPTKLAAWLTDRGGDDGRWRRTLNLSNDEHDALRGAVRVMEAAKGWGRMNVAQRKRLLAEEHWPRGQLLLAAVAPALADRIEQEAMPLLAEGVAPPPLVSGDDLRAMGMPAGPRIGTLLHEVYDAQLGGEVADREAALQWVRARINR